MLRFVHPSAKNKKQKIVCRTGRVLVSLRILLRDTQNPEACVEGSKFLLK
jgi:hypothetical protein